MNVRNGIPAARRDDVEQLSAGRPDVETTQRRMIGCFIHDRGKADGIIVKVTVGEAVYRAGDDVVHTVVNERAAVNTSQPGRAIPTECVTG